MESLGDYLRRKREERGRTVEDVARETRIQAYLLTALENDDLSPLPPPAFVRGFLRNTCRALGVPDARAIELYEERLSPSGGGASPASTWGGDATGWAARAAAGLPPRVEPARTERGHAEGERSSTFPKGLVSRRARINAAVVAVVALIAVVVLFFAVKISGGALQDSRTPTVAWPEAGTSTSAWSATAAAPPSER